MQSAILVALGIFAASHAAAQSERSFETISGRPVVVGVHPSMKDDCSRGPLVEIFLVAKPKNGSMAVQGGRIAVEGVGGCPPFEATARRVLYQPSLTFSGQDEFSYRAVDYQGRTKVHTIRITVRPRSRPGFAGDT